MTIVDKAVFSLCMRVCAGSISATRPPFVAHVDRVSLESALELAKQRHAAAVQQALEHYPTHRVVDGETDPSINTLALQEYSIEAPGVLPDFADILPRKIYVTAPEPLLTAEECAHVIQMAEDHFQGTNWSMQKSGQYDVAGFWIKDVPLVYEWFVRTVRNKLFPLLVQQFPNFVSNPHDLCVDNAYLFKYTPETGHRTDVHTDSGCLSFTIALNSNSEYKGGGTWFEGLDHNGGILEMDVGQVTIRPGGVKHCGHAIQQGVRYIIGGFCMHQHKAETIRMLLDPSGDTTAEQKQRAAEAAVTFNPQCDLPYNLLANSYLAQGDSAKAQQVFEYGLEHVHPKSGELAYPLGSLYLEQGELQKAKQAFETCLEVDDCDVDALTALAEVCASLGDTAGVEAYMKRILAASLNARILASAYCNLGVLYEGKDQEVEFYQKSLQCMPNNFAAQFSLASAYASREMWQEAVAEFKSAVRAADNDPESERQALQGLYKAAMNLAQTQATPPSSREAMVRLFQDTMGAENYAKLVALSQR